MRLFRRITSATNVPQPAHMIKAPTIKGNICLFVSGGDGSIFRPSSSDLSIEVPPLLASADPLPGTVVVLSVDDGVAAVVVTLVVDVVVGAAVVVVDVVMVRVVVVVVGGGGGGGGGGGTGGCEGGIASLVDVVVVGGGDGGGEAMVVVVVSTSGSSALLTLGYFHGLSISMSSHRATSTKGSAPSGPSSSMSSAIDVGKRSARSGVPSNVLNTTQRTRSDLFK